MRKIRNLLSAFSIMLLVISCNSNTTNNTNNTNKNNNKTLENIITKKEINVGYIIFPPTIIKNNKTGELEGIFIDMFEKIIFSVNPNIKINYQPTTLATFHAELNTHQFDICIGATFATPKRAATVAFTSPLFYCGYTGVAKKEDKDKYKTWQDIDNKDVKIAVLQGSAISDLVKTDFKNKDNIKFMQGRDITIPLADVTSGQSDVGLMNQITVHNYLQKHPELVEIMHSDPLATTYFSWSVRQDDTKWLAFLNTSIDYLINSGDMYKFERKYDTPIMHLKRDFYFPLNNN